MIEMSLSDGRVEMGKYDDELKDGILSLVVEKS